MSDMTAAESEIYARLRSIEDDIRTLNKNMTSELEDYYLEISDLKTQVAKLQEEVIALGIKVE